MALSQKFILPSSEMRWFYNWNQNDFQSVLDWLKSILKELSAEPDREDYYLHTGNPDKGIKLRPYGSKRHLEMKFLSNQENRISPFKGRKEDWTKWSVPLPKEFKVDVKVDPKWIGVEKTRYLLKISLTQSTPRVLQADGKGTKEGCNVELTQLRVKEKKYWTFSFESFSKSGKEEKNLENGLEFLSLKNPPEIIQTGISCGYMEWIIKEVL